MKNVKKQIEDLIIKKKKIDEKIDSIRKKCKHDFVESKEYRASTAAEYSIDVWVEKECVICGLVEVSVL
jgi:hypothetical protein